MRAKDSKRKMLKKSLSLRTRTSELEGEFRWQKGRDGHCEDVGPSDAIFGLKKRSCKV